MFKKLLPLLIQAVLTLQLRAATLAHWNFNSDPSDANANTGTLVPAIGAGTALLVGGVTASFTASNGSSDPSPDNSNWRITNWPPQGTQNKQNGIQFSVSTVGCRDLSVTWDLRNSNTASKYTRLQYSTNGSTFIDFAVITMPNETWINKQSISFSGVPGVENNAKFAVRFVTEFESTATGAGVNGYLPSNPTSSYGNVGTLRFDMVLFTGEASPGSVSVLCYNILGHSATNWSLNLPQVQAIGRQLSYLQPDILGLQEIPETYYTEMTNFIAAYLPGYHLVIGVRTDGGERSGVVTRFPIMRFQSWLARSDLAAFGYNGVFTRDLFEAQISVPGFAQPLHFFTTHLKAHPDEDSSVRRAAEARAISNFFVKAFLTTNALRPYVLVGDMNEDINRPRTYEQGAIQTLTGEPTGLRLTTPRNPVTNDERTWSIQNASLTIRFDYILPGELLYTNALGSQVFRSDRVSPLTPPLQFSDSATASDHLPIQMVFSNPYDAPYFIRSFSINNSLATIRWQSVPGGRYRVESSVNLIDWVTVVPNVLAQGGEQDTIVNVTSMQRFFRIARE